VRQASRKKKPENSGGVLNGQLVEGRRLGSGNSTSSAKYSFLVCGKKVRKEVGYFGTYSKRKKIPGRFGSVMVDGGGNKPSGAGKDTGGERGNLVYRSGGRTEEKSSGRVRCCLAGGWSSSFGTKIGEGEKGKWKKWCGIRTKSKLCSRDGGSGKNYKTAPPQKRSIWGCPYYLRLGVEKTKLQLERGVSRIMRGNGVAVIAYNTNKGEGLVSVEMSGNRKVVFYCPWSWQ